MNYVANGILFFLGPHPRHVEVPRLGVKRQLQLPACTIAMPDLSLICDLCRSSRQRWIPNPLSTARDQACFLMDASWVHQPLSHDGNSRYALFHQQLLLLFAPPPDRPAISTHSLGGLPNACQARFSPGLSTQLPPGHFL